MPTARNSALIIVLLLLLGGCVTRPVDSNLRDCYQQLDDLQDTIADAGVRDAQYSRVKGFPTYRTDRFWSGFAGMSLTPEQEVEWRQWLHTLGMQSLALEWQNLPNDNKRRWQRTSGLAGFDDFSRQCHIPLFNASLQRTLPAAALKVPDAYSTSQRALGLYAVTSRFARDAIADYQQEMTSLMTQGSAALTAPTRLFEAETTLISRGGFPVPAYSDLGIPQYDGPALQALLLWHTPRLQVEQQSGADLIGAARWQDGERFIDTTSPTLYTYVSYIRYRQQVLLQLNYVAWFSERPPQKEDDWDSGKLDGLVWRVTLKPDGGVLFYDSIHPCGCYHSVHLPAGSNLDIPRTGPEPLLVFRTELDEQANNPVLLIQAGTHYLINVQAQPAGTPEPDLFTFENYDQLRSLPTADGFRNWFDPDGLIAASSRKERLYLWPLGVPNAGAMRQRGHHAIAFVGRRHFDEPSVEKLLGLTETE